MVRQNILCTTSPNWRRRGYRDERRPGWRCYSPIQCAYPTTAHTAPKRLPALARMGTRLSRDSFVPTFAYLLCARMAIIGLPELYNHLQDSTGGQCACDTARAFPWSIQRPTIGMGSIPALKAGLRICSLGQTWARPGPGSKLYKQCSFPQIYCQCIIILLAPLFVV
jgi:hypothetical protein